MTHLFLSNNSRVSSRLTFSRRLMLMCLIGILLLVSAILWRLIFSAPIEPFHQLAPIDSASALAVTQMENRLQRYPDDPNAYAQLGLVLLQHVRETGDSGLYLRAGQALEQALERDSDNLDALIGQGMLAAALHDFDAAISWAEAALAINPWRAETLGILVDAYVELGRYEEAVAITQKMVDLRPGLDSYSRVSYIRELHGDLDGAIAAMQAAVDAGVPGTEAVLWSQVQLGNLTLLNGDLAAAEAVFQETLAARPGYLFGRSGLARLKMVAGDYAAATEILETVTNQLPLPEFVIELANAYEAMGMVTQAEEQRDLVRIMQRLNEAAGMNVDQELAAFEVEYGSDRKAALKMAQQSYDDRPTIFAADTLAWTLFKNGQFEEAKRYSDEALRLGTKDETLMVHAEAIRQATTGSQSLPAPSYRLRQSQK